MQVNNAGQQELFNSQVAKSIPAGGYAAAQLEAMGEKSVMIGGRPAWQSPPTSRSNDGGVASSDLTTSDSALLQAVTGSSTFGTDTAGGPITPMGNTDITTAQALVEVIGAWRSTVGQDAKLTPSVFAQITKQASQAGRVPEDIVTNAMGYLSGLRLT
jgi:hypothetical protein